MRRAGVLIAALALLGAAVPPEQERAAGEGVLCSAVFLYFAQQQGVTCHAGEDPQFQAQMLDWTNRLDEYLERNLPGGRTELEAFKIDNHITPEPNPLLCEAGEDYEFYRVFRDADRRKTADGIDAMLARDGLPTFGDCV